MRFLERIKKEKFLFEELTARDFKQKYKRTVLGMGWSLLYPLMTLFIQRLVFMHIFGSEIPHYTIYLFAGNVVWSYFREATIGGMNALVMNAHIFSKVNVPKYIFVLTKNVSAFINFCLTLIVFFVFVGIDRVPFSVSFFSVIIPIICMVIFNLGMGMILSALYMFFRDMTYLYDVFLTLLMYLSAIFYNVATFPGKIQQLFLLNPVYCYIKFFRVAIIEGNVPSLQYILLCFGYALASVCIGSLIYKKYNHEFLYYV